MGVAPRRQWLPDIAAGDGGYLAVWLDDRRGDGVVFASRIDLEGNVLDPGGIPIGDADSYDWDAKVSWDGSNYLVVWESLDGIEGVRVSPSGEVLDQTRIPIGTFDVSGGIAFDPSVASTGDGWLVVWAGCPDDDGCKVDIHAAVVDADGTVTDRFVVVDDLRRQDLPDLTAGEDEYLLLWRRVPYPPSEYSMMMLDERGQPTTEATAHPGAGTLAEYSAGTFLLVWSTGYPDDVDVVGARVTRSGEIVDSPPLRIVSGNADRYAYAVAAEGEGGWVVVSDRGLTGRLFGSHVGSDGGVSDPNGTLLVDRPLSEA